MTLSKSSIFLGNRVKKIRITRYFITLKIKKITVFLIELNEQIFIIFVSSQFSRAQTVLIFFNYFQKNWIFHRPTNRTFYIKQNKLCLFSSKKLFSKKSCFFPHHNGARVFEKCSTRKKSKKKNVFFMYVFVAATIEFCKYPNMLENNKLVVDLSEYVKLSI